MYPNQQQQQHQCINLSCHVYLSYLSGMSYACLRQVDVGVWCVVFGICIRSSFSPMKLAQCKITKSHGWGHHCKNSKHINTSTTVSTTSTSISSSHSRTWMGWGRGDSLCGDARWWVRRCAACACACDAVVVDVGDMCLIKM